MRNIILSIILILTLIVSGCSSDTNYVAPTKAEPPAKSVETKTEAPISPASVPETKPEPTKIQTFNVGETATDNQLKVTINKVRFTSTINEKNNEFLVATAPVGKQYAIVDITVENILSDKTQAVSTLTETTIIDQDGYTYSLDFTGLTALEKSFKDGEILPNMKKRGEIAFLVPKDATNLKFIYKFDLFVGTSAVFDIK